MQKLRKNDIDKATLEELYVRQKLTTREVGKIIGCHSASVSKLLRVFCIPARSTGNARQYDILNDKNWLYKKYWVEEMNSSQIAMIVGCSSTTIILYLKSYDIPRRTREERQKGKHRTEETKLKMSEAQKGRCMSKDTREKLSKINKGKTLSREHRTKISRALKGMKHTEEARRRMSEAQKGRTSPNKGKPMSEEQKKKISEAQKGRPISEEKRRHLSEVNKGKHPSEDTKQKLSDALKGRFCGEEHPNWQGGKSFEPYCFKFNNDLKERVREFFDRQCYMCGTTEEENGQKLSVHHCNYDKMVCCNNIKPLFVPLCRRCHSKVNYDRDGWIEFFEESINYLTHGKCFHTTKECEGMEEKG